MAAEFLCLSGAVGSFYCVWRAHSPLTTHWMMSAHQVLVLDKGELQEYDTPLALLQRPGSRLRYVRSCYVCDRAHSFGERC